MLKKKKKVLKRGKIKRGKPGGLKRRSPTLKLMTKLEPLPGVHYAEARPVKAGLPWTWVEIVILLGIVALLGVGIAHVNHFGHVPEITTRALP